MTLSEVGEARVRGYLFVLGQSLRAFLPGDVVKDAVAEIESHIRARLEAVEPQTDERTTVERVLQELGPPLRVAQVYAAEMTVEEALTTGRATAILRALWHLATTTVRGFAVALLLAVGYTFGVSMLIVAVLKPVFPDNVGLFVVDGVPRAFGAIFPVPAGSEILGGYWVIPICVVLGLGILVATQRGARAFLSWWRVRRAEFPVLAFRAHRTKPSGGAG
jgi:uncharacterized membrane protein